MAPKSSRASDAAPSAGVGRNHETDAASAAPTNVAKTSLETPGKTMARRHAGYPDFEGAPTPIFLHSSFRTSSTWLWAKFRTLPNVLAYYEIFNEMLGHIDAKSLNASTYASWPSHHPPQAPYFLEFLSLLSKSGGVLGFDASMSLAQFIPEHGIEGEISAGEQNYLRILIEHAHKGRKIPVLSCTRSIGRMAAVKRFMPVKNILLYRNIFDQWSSYTGQFLRGNDYFFKTIGETTGSFSRDPFLEGIHQFFDPSSLSPRDERTFSLFILMHIYLYARAIDSSDIVINTTALATDANLRHSVEAALSDLVGAHVDLSDARSHFEASIVLVQDKRQFVDTIEQFVKIIASTCSTERAAAFAFQLKEDTLSAWRRHDALSRTSISWYEKTTAELRDEVANCMTRQAESDLAIQRMTVERDLAAADLAAAKAELAAANPQRSNMASGADAIAEGSAPLDVAAAWTDFGSHLGAAFARTNAALSAAEGLISALIVERDAAASIGQTAIAAKEAAEAAASTRVAVRDPVVTVAKTAAGAVPSLAERNGGSEGLTDRVKATAPVITDKARAPRKAKRAKSTSSKPLPSGPHRKL